ncbi:MAG: NfeD family protein [Planctomycetaceae bacterium]
MSYSLLAIVLLILGLLLLVAEVFIPSSGLILVLAIGTIAGSLFCGWFAWMPTRPAAFWSLVGALVVLAPITVITAFRYWPETAIGKRALLEGPSPEEVTPFDEQLNRHEALLGHTGLTATVLNPAGIAVIDGSRVHCQSEGMIIPSGTPVRVVAARLNHVTVREYDPSDRPTRGPEPISRDSSFESRGPKTEPGGTDLDFPIG